MVLGAEKKDEPGTPKRGERAYIGGGKKNLFEGVFSSLSKRNRRFRRREHSQRGLKRVSARGGKASLREKSTRRRVREEKKFRVQPSVVGEKKKQRERKAKLEI